MTNRILENNRRHRKGNSRGFSIMEVLISIGVVSIAMLGVLGSMAFARRSSAETFRITEANAIQRRTLEMILAGGSKGPYMPSNPALVRNATNEPNGPYTGSWISLKVFADVAGTNSTNPIKPDDFTTGSTGTDDMKAFNQICDHGYDVRVTLTPGTANTYRQDLCTVLVEVRWRDATRWRQIQTSAEYRRSST